MIIYHNMKADNAHRMLGINQSGLGKNVEKLSSGLRVNRAADDAAGLFISEKMRSQVRGLNQASRNSLDGISAVQTAEGALDEVHSMLQRMRELTVQAANDPNQMQDRRAILEEMQQLGEEIESISVKTEFNKQKLLDGSFEGKKLQVGANQNQILEMSIEDLSAVKLGLGEIATEDIKHEAPVEKGGKADGATGVAVQGKTVDEATPATKAKWESVEVTDKNKICDEITIDGKRIDIRNCKTEADVQAALGKIKDLIEADKDLKDKYNVTVVGNKQLVLEAKKSGAGKIEVDGPAKGTFTAGKDVEHTTKWTSEKKADLVAAGDSEFKAEEDLTLDVNGIKVKIKEKGNTDLDGSKAKVEKALKDNEEFSKLYDVKVITGDKLEITAKDHTKATSINVKIIVGDGKKADDKKAPEASIGKIAVKKGEFNLTLDISSNEKANETLGKVDEAISKVSTQRSALGAIQNRLEHTIKNLDNAAENTQAAESRIRDIDMAKEMSVFTRNNILTQASQAMLAQANQLPQQVLQLLR